MSVVLRRTAKDIHPYNTRFASKDNLYKVRVRTNIGKQTIVSTASDIWQDLPIELKNLSTICFSERAKQYLVHRQFGS